MVAARSTRQRGEPINGKIPNDEQEEILAIAIELQESGQTGQVLVVNAGAGTGKTSTDLMLEQTLRGIGQYTAFNRPLIDEGRTKFKKASVHTTYALAFRAVGKDYQHRLNAERVKSRRVAEMMGIKELTIVAKGQGKPLTRLSDEWNAYIEKMGWRGYAPPPGSEGDALWRNLNTEEDRLVYADWLDDQGRHDHAEFVRNPHDDLVKTLSEAFLAGQVRETIVRFCQSADPVEYISDHIYSNVVSPLGDEAERQFRAYLIPFVHKMWADIQDPNGKLPFEHIHYVKMWQLGKGDKRPVIGADYILLDEAQDTPPVFLDILRQQVHALLVLVGDDNQQIYEYLGAVNAMGAFKGAPRRLLSQSYRFGQAIADVANTVLAQLSKPTDLILKGNPALPSRVAPVTNPRCYLYRTNAGAVARVMIAFEEGKRPHLIGGGKQTVEWCEAALQLQRGKKTSHPDLACFDDWGEVEEYAKSDEGADLRLMVKIVNQFGAEAIIKALKNMPKEKDADLIVSTAHKSKGREWDTVRLGGDFPTANKMNDSDCRILYVALTRAKMTLDISECPPFCGGREYEGDPGSQWIPGLRINFTREMPTEQEQKDWVLNKAGSSGGASHDAGKSNGVSLSTPSSRSPAATVDAASTRAVNAGKFTWTKYKDAWCVRGPVNAKVGTPVEVERRDGSRQTITLREPVKQYEDAWIYKI